MEIVIQMKLEVRDSKLDEMVNQKLSEMEDNGKYDMSQSSKEYETIIQKLEAEVRNHISVSLRNYFIWLCTGPATNETLYWKLSE